LYKVVVVVVEDTILQLLVGKEVDVHHHLLGRDRPFHLEQQ